MKFRGSLRLVGVREEGGLPEVDELIRLKLVSVGLI
jgi:hypothetical protein